MWLSDVHSVSASNVARHPPVPLVPAHQALTQAARTVRVSIHSTFNQSQPSCCRPALPAPTAVGASLACWRGPDPSRSNCITSWAARFDSSSAILQLGYGLFISSPHLDQSQSDIYISSALRRLYVSTLHPNPHCTIQRIELQPRPGTPTFLLLRYSKPFRLALDAACKSFRVVLTPQLLLTLFDCLLQTNSPTHPITWQVLQNPIPLIRPSRCRVLDVARRLQILPFSLALQN